MARKKKGFGVFWVVGHSDSAKKKIRGIGEGGKQVGDWKTYSAVQDTITDNKGRVGKITTLYVSGAKFYKDGMMKTNFTKQIWKGKK